MNLRTQNKLTMVGTCITVSQQPDFKNVWEGQEPAGFALELADLARDYAAVMAKAALAEAAAGGAGDAKAKAEAALEEATYIAARAMAVHFKRLGDLDRRGKVNLSRAWLIKLPQQELLSRASAIRNLTAACLDEPGAARWGITAERLRELDAAIDMFSTLMHKPREQLVNRGVLLKEAEADTAELVQRVRDLDDLIVQFAGTELGQRYIEAWKRARKVLATGGTSATAKSQSPPIPQLPEPPATPLPAPELAAAEPEAEVGIVLGAENERALNPHHKSPLNSAAPATWQHWRVVPRQCFEIPPRRNVNSRGRTPGCGRITRPDWKLAKTP